METGLELNAEFFSALGYDTTQYIILVDDKNKNGFLNITSGINETTINVNGTYAYGGYELVDINEFYTKMLYYTNYLGYYEINIPSDAKLIVQTYGFTIDKVIAVGDIKSFSELYCFKNVSYCKKALKVRDFLAQYMIYLKPEDIEEILMEIPKTIKYFGTTNRDIILHCVNSDGLLLEYVKSQDQDQDICDVATKNNFHAIKFAKYQNEDIILDNIKLHPKLFQHVIDKTEDICNLVIKKNPEAIQFIENPSYYLKLMAVSYDGLCLQYIGDQTISIVVQALINNIKAVKYAKIMNKQISEYVLNTNSSYIKYLDIQPEEICSKLVNNNGLMLEHIKPENQTLKLCQDAVNNTPAAIKYAHVQSEEMCENIVFSAPYTIKWCNIITNNMIEMIIDKHPGLLNTINMNEITMEQQFMILKTNSSLFEKISDPSNNIILFVLSINGLLLKHILFQTQEIVMTALYNNLNAIMFAKYQNTMIRDYVINKNCLLFPHITDNLLTSKICAMGVQQNCHLLEFVPMDLQTEVMCLQAVNSNMSCIRHIKISTPAIDIIMVKYNGLMLEYINDKNYELCLYAVMNNGNALKFVPSELITYDLCKQAVMVDKMSIQHVPSVFQSDELCDIALDITPNNIKYIINPSENIIIKTAMKYPYSVSYIDKKHLSESLCKKLVLMNPFLIKFIDNPSINLQLYSLKDSDNIKIIPNKSIYMYIVSIFVNIKIIDELDNETLIRIKNNPLLDNFPDIKFLINKAITDNDNKFVQSNYNKWNQNCNYNNHYSDNHYNNKHWKNNDPIFDNDSDDKYDDKYNDNDCYNNYMFN